MSIQCDKCYHRATTCLKASSKASFTWGDHLSQRQKGHWYQCGCRAQPRKGTKGTFWGHTGKSLSRRGSPTGRGLHGLPRSLEMFWEWQWFKGITLVTGLEGVTTDTTLRKSPPGLREGKETALLKRDSWDPAKVTQLRLWGGMGKGAALRQHCLWRPGYIKRKKRSRGDILDMMNLTSLKNMGDFYYLGRKRTWDSEERTQLEKKNSVLSL